MRFYTTAKLGPRRGKTPEGYLICYAVPIARSGLQTYSEREPPFDELIAAGKIKTGGNGYIKVERFPEDVFRPETMASFEGKDVVDDHPDDDVGPDNYQELSCGVVINVKRGVGIESDLMLADLIIKDSRAIDSVMDGKVQVSCGYNADYEGIGPGEARQYNILGNHVALVDSARCGGRCAIHDSACGSTHDSCAPRKGESRMARRMTFKDAMRRAFKARDAAELETIEKEAEAQGLGGGEDPGDLGATDLPAESGGAPEDTDDAIHLHLHRHDDRDDMPMPTSPSGLGDDDEEGDPAAVGDPPPDDTGGEGDPQAQIADRLEAMERDHEEMKAMLEEVMNCLEEEGSEDTRRRMQECRGGGDARTRGGRDDEEEELPPDDEEMPPPDDDDDDENMDTRDEGEGSNTNLEGNLEMEAPPGTTDRARRARDSAFLEDSFHDTLAMSEIIAPGLRAPTFDRKAKPQTTLQSIIGLRRRTLDAAYKDPSLKTLIDAIVPRYDERRRTLDCGTQRTLFRAIGGACRDRNNSATPGSYTADHGTGGGAGVIGKIKTPAELQKEIDSFWRNQGVKV